MSFFRRKPAVSAGAPDVLDYLNDIEAGLREVRDLSADAAKTLAALQVDLDDHFHNLCDLIARIHLLHTRAPAAEPNPWPEGVVARYLTVVGGHVDISDVTEPYDDSARFQAACNGCGADSGRYYGPDCIAAAARGEYALDEARGWAQRHAEKCRALPKAAALTETGGRS